VPTEYCTTHKETDICKASGHVANQYCSQVEGNSIYQLGLLDVSRAFPVPGIVVQDQGYVVPGAVIPNGYYEAVSPDVDSINVPCYIHSEADLPKPEVPETTETDGETGTETGTGGETGTDTPRHGDRHRHRDGNRAQAAHRHHRTDIRRGYVAF
jgi:hypothetical protein